jgi:hypothetical protein
LVQFTQGTIRMEQVIKDRAFAEKRQELDDMLHQHVCEVTFTKVNGELRTMPCTLKEELIPPAPVHVTNTSNPVDFPVVKKEKKFNPDVMSVWCLDKKEWRSFRVANVTEVRVLND